MAALYGVNVTRAQSGFKADPGMYNGHIKHRQDDITFAAELAVGDTISLGVLPKGAKIQSVKIVNSASLTAGAFKIGYQPTSADQTDRTSDILVATNAFAAGLALNQGMANDAISESKEVILTCTTATTSATGKKMRVAVSFVAD